MAVNHHPSFHHFPDGQPRSTSSTRPAGTTPAGPAEDIVLLREIRDSLNGSSPWSLHAFPLRGTGALRLAKQTAAPREETVLAIDLCCLRALYWAGTRFQQFLITTSWRAMRIAANRLDASARRARRYKCRTVVRAGAHQQQAQRDIDALLDPRYLTRISPGRGIATTTSNSPPGGWRPHEPVSGEGPLIRPSARAARGRRDDSLLFAARQPAFTGMQVGPATAMRGARPNWLPPLCVMRKVCSTLSKVTASMAPQ